ncbi:hypothetical protein RKE29_00135 [Streptomyces sp. B1866]|uniref:DUF6801 domain-containing protein n=1 Tax=Streptomyces sp. B1866 TaxID=3075431 RepID=UPI00288F19F4|nr:DUF6801 domain-containing protein [Streptomyces sp. B1866]MDT3395082.1 hypothetical protein [Streptomyces sp. B1866]
MRTRATKRTRLRATTATAATIGLAAAVLGTVGVGSASAVPVSLTLNYSCVFPLLDEQPIQVKISSDIPQTIAVNTPTGKINISTVTTVNADVTTALGLVGATTLQGSAKASATVSVPQGKVTVKPTFAIPSTNVPEEGSFTVAASGAAPSLQFRQAGSGTITVGDIVLTLSIRNGAGAVIDLDDDGNETFTAPCTQLPGQNNVLAKFTITA